jgi:hypothetical protein
LEPLPRQKIKYAQAVRAFLSAHRNSLNIERLPRSFVKACHLGSRSHRHLPLNYYKVVIRHRLNLKEKTHRFEQKKSHIAPPQLIGGPKGYARDDRSHDLTSHECMTEAEDRTMGAVPQAQEKSATSNNVDPTRPYVFVISEVHEMIWAL